MPRVHFSAEVMILEVTLHREISPLLNKSGNTSMPVQKDYTSSGQVVSPSQRSESGDNLSFSDNDLSDLLEAEPRDFPGYTPRESTSDTGPVSGSSTASQSSSDEFGTVTLRVHRESPYINVHGEPFRIRKENGHVILTHDRWSLRGSGSGLIEAVDDLHECARRLAPAYVYRTPERMTAEAARMRDYIAHLISYAFQQT